MPANMNFCGNQTCGAANKGRQYGRQNDGHRHGALIGGETRLKLICQEQLGLSKNFV